MEGPNASPFTLKGLTTFEIQLLVEGTYNADGILLYYQSVDHNFTAAPLVTPHPWFTVAYIIDGFVIFKYVRLRLAFLTFSHSHMRVEL